MTAACPDHEAALRLAFDQLTEVGVGDLVAVGHRVVHGGEDLYPPTVIDDAVIEPARELARLAPLPQPAGRARVSR